MYKLLQKIKKNSDMRFHDKYHIGCNKCSSNKGTPSHTLFEKKRHLADSLSPYPGLP